jgi:hypothetical protein
MNIQELIQNIQRIDDYDADQRFTLAIKSLTEHKISLSIDIVADLLCSMGGTKRSEKLLRWMIENNYLIVNTVTPNSVSEMLKKCSLTKDSNISTELTDKLKQYKRSSNGIPKNNPTMNKIITYSFEKTNILSMPKLTPKDSKKPEKIIISGSILNPPKDKRYPTPERKVQSIEMSESLNIVFYSYEELTKKINQHPKNIEGLIHSNYEKHLNEEEFEKVFKMKQHEFYKLPIWRQLLLKKHYMLF